MEIVLLEPERCPLDSKKGVSTQAVEKAAKHLISATVLFLELANANYAFHLEITCWIKQAVRRICVTLNYHLYFSCFHSHVHADLIELLSYIQGFHEENLLSVWCC